MDPIEEEFRPDDLKWPSFEDRLAIHEAGHVVAGHFFGFRPLEVHIRPVDRGVVPAGTTYEIPSGQPERQSIAEVIVVRMAGLAAEVGFYKRSAAGAERRDAETAACEAERLLGLGGGELPPRAGRGPRPPGRLAAYVRGRWPGRIGQVLLEGYRRARFVLRDRMLAVWNVSQLILWSIDRGPWTTGTIRVGQARLLRAIQVSIERRGRGGRTS